MIHFSFETDLCRRNNHHSVYNVRVNLDQAYMDRREAFRGWLKLMDSFTQWHNGSFGLPRADRQFRKLRAYFRNYTGRDSHKVWTYIENTLCSVQGVFAALGDESGCCCHEPFSFLRSGFLSLRCQITVWEYAVEYEAQEKADACLTSEKPAKTEGMAREPKTC